MEDRDRDADRALAAAKEAVRQCQGELFSILGVNIADFKDVQKLRDDLEFVRGLRTGASKIGAKFVLTMISVIAGAVAIGAWEFAKTVIAHWWAAISAH